MPALRPIRATLMTILSFVARIVCALFAWHFNWRRAE
jgi:hypothetical protein